MGMATVEVVACRIQDNEKLETISFFEFCLSSKERDSPLTNLMHNNHQIPNNTVIKAPKVSVNRS